MEPGFFDAGGEVEFDLEGFALDFGDVGGDEEWRWFGVSGAFEVALVVACELIDAGAGVGFDAEVIGESAEEGFGEGFWRVVFVVGVLFGEKAE